MRTSLLVALVLVGAILGCGNAVQQGSTQLTQNPQCGDQPMLNPGGQTATAAACSFERQALNIQVHGEALSATLSDAQGNSAAMMMECGTFFMGTDANGNTVIINRSNGEVDSHGMFHDGYATSSLPAFLSLPLQLDPR